MLIYVLTLKVLIKKKLFAKYLGCIFFKIKNLNIDRLYVNLLCIIYHHNNL
jgi:hypothetical protein